MLTEAFTLLIQLPPLAFGPPLPAPAFAAPRELTCDIRDLGQVQTSIPAARTGTNRTILDPRTLKPRPERRLLNPALEFVMVMGVLAVTHGSWDERSWSAKTWQVTGAVTPTLIPPLAPPTWGFWPR